MQNLESVAQKNGWVIALGTTEDTVVYTTISSVDYTVQTSLFKVQILDNYEGYQAQDFIVFQLPKI